MWSRVLILVFAVPGLLAIPDIDEKYLQDIMVREGQKENQAVEYVKLLQLYALDRPETMYGYNRTRAEIEVFLKSGEHFKKSLLVIAHPYDQTDKLNIFKNQIELYKGVFPKMDEYLVKHGSHDQNKMWVKTYDVDQYNRLVIEDLEDLHYYPIPLSSVGLDFDHSKVAIENIAKFHALSAVLKNKNYIDVTPFDLSIGEQYKQKTGLLFRNTFANFVKSIRAAWGVEWENTAKYFEQKIKTVENEMQAIWHRDDSKFNVLVPGPFMAYYFKYQDDASHKHPTAMKAIDYRYTYWNSAILDLQRFINTRPIAEIVTDDALRQKLINHYVEVLSAYLQKYGFETPVTKEYVQTEIRRTELYGLVSAISFLEELYQYAEKYIVDTTNQEINFEIKGMLNPHYIDVLKKLVARAQKLGVIQY